MRSGKSRSKSTRKIPAAKISKEKAIAKKKAAPPKVAKNVKSKPAEESKTLSNG